jgi:hypothetical protein
MMPLIASLLAAVAGFGTGFLVADDADEVDRVRADAAKLAHAQEKETRRADQLASQLADSDVEINKLEDRLAKAEEGGSRDRSSSGVAKDEEPQVKIHKLGTSAIAGSFTLTPASLTKTTGGSGSATWTATVTVKNNARESTSPFCGGTGATLLDTQDRSFDPEAVISESSATCEDIQPGLTRSNLQFTFELPTSAKPRLLKLWGDTGNESNAQLWSVKQ